MTFAALPMLNEERRIDQLLAVLPVADGQCQVVLFNLAIAKHRVQRSKRTAPFGQHQATRGFAIQAVRQRQVPELGPCIPQYFNGPEAHTTAAVHCHARRLVDHKHIAVFEEQVFEQGTAGCRGWSFAVIIYSDRRDPHLVARCQFVLCTNPAAVHAHFAATQYPVQTAFWQTGQFPAQEVVDSLPGLLLIDSDFSHPGLAQGGIRLASSLVHFQVRLMIFK